MEPAIFTKQAWEKRTLEFDLTPSLATGDSVASAVVTVWEGVTDRTATMLSGVVSVVGNTVLATIQAGSDAVTYWVRVRATTTAGDQIEDDLKLLVRNVGG